MAKLFILAVLVVTTTIVSGGSYGSRMPMKGRNMGYGGQGMKGRPMGNYRMDMGNYAGTAMGSNMGQMTYAQPVDQTNMGYMSSMQGTSSMNYRMKGTGGNGGSGSYWPPPMNKGYGSRGIMHGPWCNTGGYNTQAGNQFMRGNMGNTAGYAYTGDMNGNMYMGDNGQYVSTQGSWVGQTPTYVSSDDNGNGQFVQSVQSPVNFQQGSSSWASSPTYGNMNMQQGQVIWQPSELQQQQGVWKSNEANYFTASNGGNTVQVASSNPGSSSATYASSSSAGDYMQPAVMYASKTV